MLNCKDLKTDKIQLLKHEGGANDDILDTIYNSLPIEYIEFMNKKAGLFL